LINYELYVGESKSTKKKKEKEKKKLRPEELPQNPKILKKIFDFNVS
jgi:hypothetical protein